MARGTVDLFSFLEWNCNYYANLLKKGKFSYLHIFSIKMQMYRNLPPWAASFGLLSFDERQNNECIYIHVFVATNSNLIISFVFAKFAVLLSKNEK